MKFSKLFSYPTLYFLTISAALLLGGCSNPADSGGEAHHHHDHATGVVLKMNGAEIVRYEDGQVTGQLEVAAGEGTALITLYFLNEEGGEFQPDEPEYSLEWTVADESVAEIEQHAEDGKWSFHIHGIAQGTTSVIFELFHGDHADFETPEIPITVN